jgi:hypothetical protein
VGAVEQFKKDLKQSHYGVVEKLHVWGLLFFD